MEPHARGPGRPKTSKLSRTEQLRAAKQRERARRRNAGLRKVQIELPETDAVRLRMALADAGFRRAATQLLNEYVVDLHRYPALRELAWNRVDRWVTAPEALALYERNWRHVDKDSLGDDERALIKRLTHAFGGGHLNV
jgi:hypothetical protein